jgi:poly(3-hydroxybutyrate) depolymerase
MEAILSSEAVAYLRTTRRHNPQYRVFQADIQENVVGQQNLHFVPQMIQTLLKKNEVCPERFVISLYSKDELHCQGHANEVTSRETRN